MKIIRPEYTPPKKEEKTVDTFGENATLIIDGHEVTPFESAVIEQEFSIENLMEEVLQIKLPEKEPNEVSFEITLTKKQKELFDKKGGEKWLKKALVGQKYRK